MKPSNMRIFSYVITLVFLVSFLFSLNHAVTLPLGQMLGYLADKLLILGVGVFLMIHTRKNGPYEKAWEKKREKS